MDTFNLKTIFKTLVGVILKHNFSQYMVMWEKYCSPEILNIVQSMNPDIAPFFLIQKWFNFWNRKSSKSCTFCSQKSSESKCKLLS